MPAPIVHSPVEAEVSVGGTLLGGDFTIGSITIHHEINAVPVATITIPDGKPAKQNFPLSEGSEPELKIGAEVSITFARKASSLSAELFKGLLVRHRIEVRQGISNLVLEAKAWAVKMTIGEKNAYFKDKKDSEIIKALIGNASGASAKMDDTSYKHKVFFQHQCTDWDFMLMRARALGLVVICDGKEISVNKPDFSQKKSLELTYGVNIVAADLEFDGHDQPQSVKAVSWSPKDVKLVETTKKAPGTKVSEKQGKDWTGDSIAKELAPEATEIIHRGALEKAVLDTWAESRMMYSRMGRITGSLRTSGFEIKPGDSLDLKGLGKRLSGEIYITGVRHTLAAGVWDTTLQVGLSEKWYRQGGTGNAGAFAPGTKGLCPALITKIDEDPDSLHRYEVNLNFWGTSPPCKVWARMAFPNAGKKRGFFWAPSVGDEVIVGFMDGDPCFPIILGAMFNGKSAPPVTVDTENGEMGIYTASEIKMVFNDKDKILAIETPGGHKWTLDDDGEKVEVEDSNGSKITLDSGGITSRYMDSRLRGNDGVGHIRR